MYRLRLKREIQRWLPKFGRQAVRHVLGGYDLSTEGGCLEAREALVRYFEPPPTPIVHRLLNLCAHRDTPHPSVFSYNTRRKAQMLIDDISSGNLL